MATTKKPDEKIVSSAKDLKQQVNPADQVPPESGVELSNPESAQAVVKDIQDANANHDGDNIILPEREVLKVLNIYQKLLIIQSMIDGFVKRGKGNNYNYVDGNQVLNTIRPMMNDLGLILKQEITSVKNERYDYVTGSGKAKTEVLSLVDMVFTWINTDTGEKDVNTFSAVGMNDFDKGVGSALTYGERYFLLKFFHVPTDADDTDALKPRDNQGSAGKAIQQVKVDKSVTPVQVTQADIHKANTTGQPVKGSGVGSATPSPSAVAKDPRPPLDDADKKWLNEKDPAYDGAMKKLFEGTTTIEKIAGFYKISKAMRETFKEQIAAGQRNRFGGNS